MPATPIEKASAFTGCLVGTAVGDALGLPREGLSPQRAQALYGRELRHCFLPGRGMVSDDTEHAAMTAQSLLAVPEDPEGFANNLAWRLRWWLVALPAGVGLATARSCLRLCLGVPPDRSGVFSAGNGPMMRAPIIGLLFADRPDAMRSFVAASTRLTHTDPKAERAAFAVALAASFTRRNPEAAVEATTVIEELCELIPDADEELAALLERVRGPEPLSALFPRGPGGYCYHTLLAVLHCWLHTEQGFGAALRKLLALGGDADTTGAILGGIAGATLGHEAIPEDWVRGITEWPRSVRWLQALGKAVAQAKETGAKVRCPFYFAPGALPRNALFLAVVLGHGFYRYLWPGRRPKA